MNAPDPDVLAIDAIRQQLEAAENAADADAAAALMTADVVLMVPDFPVQEGIDACTLFMRELMSWLHTEFNRCVTYASDEIFVVGDMACDRGTFSFSIVPRSGGDIERVTGKYLWLLRRGRDRTWKVARLIMSRDEQAEQLPSGQQAETSTESA